MAMRSAPALKPSIFGRFRNLKRSPSAAQWASIGSQKAGSGVLLMMTMHSRFGQFSRATPSSVCFSISGGSL